MALLRIPLLATAGGWESVFPVFVEIREIILIRHIALWEMLYDGVMVRSGFPG